MKSMRGLEPRREEPRRSEGEGPGPEAAAAEPPLVQAPRWTPAERLGRRPLFFC